MIFYIEVKKRMRESREGIRDIRVPSIDREN